MQCNRSGVALVPSEVRSARWHRPPDEAHHTVMPTVQQSDESSRSCGEVMVRSLERRLPSPLSWRCRLEWASAAYSRICRESMGDTHHFSRSQTLKIQVELKVGLTGGSRECAGMRISKEKSTIIIGDMLSHDCSIRSAGIPSLNRVHSRKRPC